MAEFLASKAQRGLPAVAGARQAEAERLDMYTALPGRIVSFDPQTQRATVKVMYKTRLNGEAVNFPDLLEVPVVQPRSAGYAITFPIQPGDGVQLQFQSRSMEAWYETGDAAEATQARMHDLSDAVAIPGLEPGTRPIQNYDPANMTVTGPNGTVTMTPAGDFDVASPAGQMSLKADGEFAATNDAGGVLKMSKDALFQIVGGPDGEDVLQVVADTLQALLDASTISGGGFNPATIASLQGVQSRLSSVMI